MSQRPLIRFLSFAARVLLLCSPQVLLSWAIIHAYARAFIFPASATGVHLATILTGQVAFFSLWAGLLRWAGSEPGRGWRGAFAAALVIKGLALNLVYASSYTSYQLWSAYISWQNLTALLPHFEGFYEALGPAFVAALGGAAVAVAVGYMVLYNLTPRLLRWVRWTYAEPAAGGFSVLLFTLCSLLAGYLWFVTIDGFRLAERDPLYAFWASAAQRKPVLTPEMLADRAARNYTPPATFHRRNVIVIIIDCLRSDHLSFRGYRRDTTPFLASLARAGRFQSVDFAVSNGNDSPQGIRTILSSRYPHHQNFHNFKLHDVLKRAGYRTHVIATGDHTTLADMRRHYGPNLDVFADGLTSLTASVNDDRGLLEALAKIGPADGQPAFFFFHLMSAHSLGVRDPAFQRWNPSLLKMDWGSMISGNYNPELMTNTYDNGLAQADHFLERIFAELEAKGYLRDYVAVLTGDHGEGLGERGNYGHTRFLYMEDIRVPILFFESTPVDYGPLPFASHVDIAPTLLDRLGLPRPDRWSGRSLFQAAPPEVTYAVGSRDNTWRAVILRRDGEFWKYLAEGRTRADFREYLFNLSRDPGERTNLLAKDPAPPLADEMRRLAVQQFNRPIPPPE